MLRFLSILVSLALLVAILGTAGVLAAFWHYGRDLPDYRQLADYEPAITTRVYAGDGRLLEEYAVERRSFVPIESIPERVIHAFVSAEDKTFFSHFGLDPTGVARAVLTNIRNLGSGRRPVGASTITQQVAKNFLLTNEVSIERKIKEAILALRIERAFPKEHILELYLNEIYLGFGSYGVAAAAVNYFGKGLDELSIAEAAFLAALPKAPNNYNPRRYPDAAKARRDWVIKRMLEDGHISREQAEAAWEEPLVVRPRPETQIVEGADHFAEEVRRLLLDRYGENALYEGGLAVRTTLDPTLQRIADEALRNGLIAYDRRHGWRGPIARIDLGDPAGWLAQLRAMEPPGGMGNWQLAVVLSVADDAAEVGLRDGGRGSIPYAELRWARPWIEGQRFGHRPKTAGDVLAPGDVVAVEAVSENDDGEGYPPQTYALRQLPEIEGAVVALDPHTGRVLAMSGGFSYERSQFNRATQALRQPGSAFKPFVYLAALENGYTPSSLVMDAPIVLEQGPGLPRWKPANYHDDFLGATTLRVGIEKSRNLMTVRLAQALGMDTIADYARRFGIYDDLPRMLSMSLGAGETTLLRLTAAYGMIVNGGKAITPTVIDRIQDRHGRTVYRHDDRPCPGCGATVYEGGDMPEIPDDRKQVVSPASAYQMVSILQGVVQRGTGWRARAVGKPLGGKTGTSNDSFDAWFIGFSPDLVVGVFVGFDEPRTLGRGETGSSVAAPIFTEVMQRALEGKPATPFRVPPGIRLVRVNAETGAPARPGDENVILEAFKPDEVPGSERTVLQGNGVTFTTGQAGGNGAANDDRAPVPEAGGLY